MRIMLALHHVANENAGAPGATLRLGAAIRDLGHEVITFLYDDAFDTPTETVEKAIAYPWRLAARVRRDPKGFDIVDASLGDAWVWDAWGRPAQHRPSPLQGPLARPRLVGRSHGLEHVAHEALMRRVRKGSASVRARYHVYHGGFRLWEVARTCRRSDAVVLLNEADRQYAVQRLGVAEIRTRVIPNGVAEYFFREEARAERAMTDTESGRPGRDPLRVLFVGGWIPRKGTADLIKGCMRTIEAGVHLSLTIAGTGKSEGEVLAEVPAAMRPLCTVYSHVANEQLPKVYAAHDVFVFPSLSEGWGIVIGEAMAIGLPVVVTPVGLGPELRDGVDALTIPLGSPEAIADALCRLARDPELRRRLGAEARRTAQRFRWSAVAKQTVGLYDELLTGK